MNYTRTDFLPFADSQKNANIYSVFLYPVYTLQLNTFIIIVEGELIFSIFKEFF